MDIERLMIKPMTSFHKFCGIEKLEKTVSYLQYFISYQMIKIGSYILTPLRPPPTPQRMTINKSLKIFSPKPSCEMIDGAVLRRKNS